METENIPVEGSLETSHLLDQVSSVSRSVISNVLIFVTG